LIRHAPGFFKKSFFNSRFLHYPYLSEAVIRTFIKTIPEKLPGTLNEKLFSDFTGGLLKTYLKYEDRCSMWHSVEARTPFADDLALIEYVFQLPGSFKIQNGMNKYILREAAKKYLPSEIANRKNKTGYTTPFVVWLKQIKNSCCDYFDSSLEEYLLVKKIKSDYDRLFSVNNSSDAARVFKLISFAVWKKVFKL